MRLLLFAIVVLLPMLTGCGSSTQTVQAWTSRQGGLLDGAPEARAQRVARQVLDLPADAPVPLHVLANTRVDAYSWPSGEMYVTTGLLDAFDDEQLAAAIAHEAGHIAMHHGSRKSAPPFGATGNRSTDVEADADARGAELLAARGIAPQAMQRMLESLLASPTCSSHCRGAVRQRIELLDRRWPRLSR